MTPVKHEVRIASRSDAPALFTMCMDLWKENGIFTVSEQKVRAFIDNATNPTLDTTASLSVIGVLGEPGERLHGSIAMCVSQQWYTDEWHVDELWNFVRPEFRYSHNAKALLEFSKNVRKQLKLPLVIGILSSDRTEQKIRLYERNFGPKAGAYFVYPPWSELRDGQEKDAAGEEPTESDQTPPEHKKDKAA